MVSVVVTGTCVVVLPVRVLVVVVLSVFVLVVVKITVVGTDSVDT